MRILFKTPHQLVFRRCFLVSESYEKDGFLVVVHGVDKRKTTKIPLAGTIFRYIR